MYLTCSIHALGRIPQITPQARVCFAHCLNKPTRKHTEVRDNRIIRKSSHLIILNSSVLSVIYTASPRAGYCNFNITLLFTYELSTFALQVKCSDSLDEASPCLLYKDNTADQCAIQRIKDSTSQIIKTN